jgi:hypothetical protein
MYDVVVLMEQELSALDADQIVALHEGLDDTVAYHLLLPVEDAAARVESALGSLAANDALMPPGAVLTGDEEDLERIQVEVVEHSKTAVRRSIEQLARRGREVDGGVTMLAPVDALAALVSRVNAREALILTRSHLVADFFHVDWTSQARRRLGVPVLHLLEHETFAEQSGGGEGISGA